MTFVCVLNWQGMQDEVPNARGLEDQATQPVSAPVSPSTPAEDPAAGLDRPQQTTAEKPVQESDSSGSQPVIDVKVNAGSADQVCTQLKLSEAQLCSDAV